MKTICYPSLLILSLILIGCDKTIDISELVERKGVHYQINSNKPFDGTVFSHHENGQVKTSGNYEKGLKEGLFEEFYDNGQLLYSVNYFMGEKEGVEKTYFENGNIHFISNYKNNLLTGVKETYFENGQMNLKEKYKDGVLEDITRFNQSGDEILTISFYIDGNYARSLSKSSEVILKIGDNIIREGKIEGDGVWKYLKRSTGEPFTGFINNYKDNGQLRDRGYIENGMLHGVIESFHDNEVIKERLNMYDGKIEGLYETFHENGNLKQKKCYQNDEEVEMSFCDER